MGSPNAGGPRHDRAVDSWPPSDRNLPIALANLATALYDRFDDAGDLKRAVPLYKAALPA